MRQARQGRKFFRRGLLAALVAAALPLTLGTATAGAQSPSSLFGGGGLLPELSMEAPVAGTVVSTDPAHSSFVAKAYALSDLWRGGLGLGGILGSGGGSGLSGILGSGGLGGILGSGGLGGVLGSGGLGGILGSGGLGLFGHDITLPPTTEVTITTDSSTFMIVNAHMGTVADMTSGDKFIALFKGSPFDSIQTLTANPAVAVFDHSRTVPKRLYGFVGNVTGTDTTSSTVSVKLTATIPGTLGSPGSSATFTVGDHTLILGGSTVTGSLGRGLFGFGGSLDSVKNGDIVAGVVVAPQGETLTQVEAQPLNLLLDFPAPATSSAALRVKAKALREMLALMGGQSIGSSSHKTHKKHHKTKKSHRHAHKA